MEENGRLLRNEASRRRKKKTSPQNGSRLVCDETPDVVYFLRWRVGDIHLVKVGVTGFFPSRLADHRNTLKKLGSFLDDDDVLALVSGNENDESVVKSSFAQFRWNGESELFVPDPEVVDYIRWLRDRPFVVVGNDRSNPDRPWPPSVVPVACATEWLPDETRRKSRPQTNEDVSPQCQFDFLRKKEDAISLGPREVTLDDYYTPSWIIDLVHLMWPEGIDLDPASHAIANSTIRAKVFFSKRENGLIQPWHGRVWLNPPFGDWKQFAQKVLDSLKDMDEILMLAGVHAITSRYFKSVLEGSDACCVLTGRPYFSGPNSTENSAPMGFVVVYYGPLRERFSEVFNSVGVVCAPVRIGKK